MKKYIIAIVALLTGCVSFAQIAVMEFKKKEVRPEAVAYDSLKNMVRQQYDGRFTYHHLIGQTVMFVGDKDDESFAPKFNRGDYFTIDSILSDNTDKGWYNVLSLTNINTGKTYVDHCLGAGNGYNRRWVVLGYYLKAKEMYQGREFVYKGISSDFYMYRKTHLYNMYSIPENAEVKDIPINSVWKCVDVQVVPRTEMQKYEYLSGDYRNPVALIFENEKLGKAYCYIEDEYGSNYSKEHYLSGSKVQQGLVCGRFLSKDIYDRQVAHSKAVAQRNRQIAAQQRLNKERTDAERQRVAKQKEAARKESIISKYGAVNGNRILHGEIWIGMTSQMCRDAIGAPYDINRTRTAYSTHEQWVYGSKYVYFDNGICTAIQD